MRRHRHLKAEVSEDRVAAVSFEGVGCTLSQAAASILAERTNRLQPAFEEVLGMSYEEMLDLVGCDIAASRPRAPHWRLGR